jgi:hypothetical protein
MKASFFLLFTFISMIISWTISCGSKPIPGLYTMQFPSSPNLRMELLSESHWMLEYYDSKGNFRQKEAAPGSLTKIDILMEWPSALLAWPYWPEKSLSIGHFYPAGALFPLDASGDTIILSWKAGAEAYFFREMEKAQELNSGTNRVPMYFDWKRFRALLRGHDNPELRNDPWLADWKDIAQKTVRSGFRQSYIQTEKRTSTDIIIPHDGPWLSASPFRPPEFWETNDMVSLLLSPRPELLVCPGGKLNASSKIRLWVPY